MWTTEIEEFNSKRKPEKKKIQFFLQASTPWVPRTFGFASILCENLVANLKTSTIKKTNYLKTVIY